jgi:hypothetical protein
MERKIHLIPYQVNEEVEVVSKFWGQTPTQLKFNGVKCEIRRRVVF